MYRNCGNGGVRVQHPEVIADFKNYVFLNFDVIVQLHDVLCTINTCTTAFHSWAHYGMNTLSAGLLSPTLQPTL